jgi:hypothetical protein
MRKVNLFKTDIADKQVAVNDPVAMNATIREENI